MQKSCRSSQKGLKMLCCHIHGCLPNPSCQNLNFFAMTDGGLGKHCKNHPQQIFCTMEYVIFDHRQKGSWRSICKCPQVPESSLKSPQMLCSPVFHISFLLIQCQCTKCKGNLWALEGTCRHLRKLTHCIFECTCKVDSHLSMQLVKNTNKGCSPNPHELQSCDCELTAVPSLHGRCSLSRS